MRVIVILLGLAIWSGRADAYPQFQLSTGNDSCKQCHFSPGGGGLINEYGRDEAGSTLAWKEGDGGFLHGKWLPPETLQLGVDLRFLGGVRSRPSPASGAEGLTEPMGFPMQMEVYVRPKIGPVSLYVNAGARPGREGILPGSREHYVMYEPEDAAWYVRAGRFFPVYGIRTQDHTSYTRRHLQQYVYEEPYGVAFGKLGVGTELHVSAFVRSPDVLGTGRDSGVAAYYERRDEEATSAIAGQVKATLSDTDRRAWLGGVYKRWMDGPGLMFLGQLDLGVQTFTAGGDAKPRGQAVGYAGVTYMKQQGFMFGGALQVYDPDLTLEGTSREAAELNFQWFPYPHFELHVLTRVETLGLEVSDPVILALAQLHYYL